MITTWQVIEQTEKDLVLLVSLNKKPYLLKETITQHNHGKFKH